MKRPCPISNKQQAELIEGGEFLINDAGTAPGIFCQKGNKIFVVLPGPPRENQPMIQSQLFPKLKGKDFVKGSFHTKIYRIYNVGESAIADLFRPFKEDIEIGFYPVNGGWCEIHLSKYITKKDQLKKLSPIIKKAEKILKQLENIDKNSDEFKGNVGNKGYYKGVVKIIHFSVDTDFVKEIDDMKRGQVLVSGSTGPEMLLACKKAGARIKYSVCNCNQNRDKNFKRW